MFTMGLQTIKKEPEGIKSLSRTQNEHLVDGKVHVLAMPSNCKKKE